jgi:hypothetical protein
MNEKAAAAKARSEERKANKERLRKLTTTLRLSFVQVGIYTIAYKRDRRDLLTISTAIRHPNDKQDLVMGKLIAAERFMNSERIQIKKSSYDTPSDALREMFAYSY